MEFATACEDWRFRESLFGDLVVFFAPFAHTRHPFFPAFFVCDVLWYLGGASAVSVLEKRTIGFMDQMTAVITFALSTLSLRGNNCSYREE